jgi:COP9 signalosome complex subunit 5
LSQNNNNKKKLSRSEMPTTTEQLHALAWQQANGVLTTDAFYNIDDSDEKALRRARPWASDVNYFNKVYMSASALLKIIMHAKTGQGQAGVMGASSDNWVEVMGMCAGHVMNNAFIIRDSFALPVDATEVEAALNAESMVYMIDWVKTSRDVIGRNQVVNGYYHSHPGYGCYMSGTDVNTQRNNQQNQDPMIALVVDPVRSISTGKVEIRAFRTYPASLTGGAGGFGTTAAATGGAAPRAVVADVSDARQKEFGAWAHCYYEVPIVVYKSAADAQQLQLLWAQYWVTLLCSSPLTTNRTFLTERLRQVEGKLAELNRQQAHGGGTTTVGRHSGAVTRTMPAASVPGFKALPTGPTPFVGVTLSTGGGAGADGGVAPSAAAGKAPENVTVFHLRESALTQPVATALQTADRMAADFLQGALTVAVKSQCM